MSFVKELIKSFCIDLWSWSVNCAEEITGVSIGVITFLNIQVFNEFIHSAVSIMSAIVSAYLISKLKVFWAKKGTFIEKLTLAIKKFKHKIK